MIPSRTLQNGAKPYGLAAVVMAADFASIFHLQTFLWGLNLTKF